MDYKTYYEWLREGPKIGKGRDQGGLETNKHEKIEHKRDKRGWLRVNRWLVSILVCLTPLFALYSLSYNLIKSCL